MNRRLMRNLCFGLTLLLLGGSSAIAQDVSRLQDDFYNAVNAQWLSIATIRADRAVTGAFTEISDAVEETLKADFADMLSGKTQPGNTELANFVEFYRLAMDFAARDALGAAPLLPYLERIESLQSLEDFNLQWANWLLSDLPSPFTIMVDADMGNTQIHSLYLSEPELFLPDRSYYETEEIKQPFQDVYAAMSANLLMLAGKSEADAKAIVRQALAFDESLAPHVRSAEEIAQYSQSYNPINLADFDAQVMNFDFTSALTEVLGARPEMIICEYPRYFEAMDELVNANSFEAMKSWMLVKTVNSLAECLSEDFYQESGRFERFVTGIAEAPSQADSAYLLATGYFGEVVGIYYGKTYFGEQARQDVADMVQAFINTYKNRLTENTWLGPATRALAIRKLDNMLINVGYPDEPRPLFGQLQTAPASEGGTLLGAVMEFERLYWLDNLGKWNTPVDRSLWLMSAHIVNAMYSPQDNSINFPAAILQAPFYSLSQSDSANYGGIGAVIAHEISHGFDPDGAKFDEHGNLFDWWTAEDYAKFEQLSQAMIDQFNGLEFAGGRVNGVLTVTENVADAGGLACALEAVKLEPDFDLVDFFTNWAAIWRQKSTPEYEAMLLRTNPHAPGKLRANIQVQNLDDFYLVFDVKEGDGMYRAPKDRVVIW